MAETTLSEKIAERDRLNREIAEAREAAADAYAGALDAIYAETYDWAKRLGLTVTESHRKNVTTLHVAGIAVNVGYPEPQYSGFLSVTMPDGEIRFDWIPAPAVVTGLVSLLLGEKGNGDDS